MIDPRNDLDPLAPARGVVNACAMMLVLLFAGACLAWPGAVLEGGLGLAVAVVLYRCCMWVGRS